MSSSTPSPTNLLKSLFGNDVILALAPMEGVMDYSFRQIITQFSGIDFCVTEFMRVTNSLHPESLFLKYCPELQTNSKTLSGIPVIYQILGSDKNALAENAARAVELGAFGIDLNFGCPARTVNRHDGGASLLKTPERVYKAISSVRAAVPKHISVSAKMRLGFDNPATCLDVAPLVEAAGADWLTVHCRTKVDGYKPGAKWEWISKINEVTKIPVIVNGDVACVDSFSKCKSATDADSFMIGRASLSNPLVFSNIRKSLKENNETLSQPHMHSWAETQTMIKPFFDLSASTVSPWYAQARTKQWLNILRSKHSEASELFQKVKTITNPLEFIQYL